MARHSGTHFGGYSRPVRPWLAALPLLAMLLLSSTVRTDEFHAVSTAVKKIKFASNNGTAPFDQSITGTSLGVVGKALICWWTDQTAEGGAASALFGFGVAVDSANDKAQCMACANEDNVATTNCATSGVSGSIVNRVIKGINPSGTLLYDASFKSWDGTDGNFTITWQTNPGAGRIFHALVIGGDDVSANVKSFAPNTSTGNQSYTHGLGTTPTFGLWFTGSNATSSLNFALGCAVSTSKRWSFSVNADDAVTMTASMDWNRYHSNTRCLTALSVNASTLDVEFDFVSFDATNVTFNQINAPGLSNYSTGCLYLAGGQYDCGTFFKCTTANCTDSPAVAFQPKATMQATAGIVSANMNTVQASGRFGLGGGTSTDGTAEGSIAVQWQDALLNTAVDMDTTSAKVLEDIQIGSSTVASAADQTALGATSFSDQWTTQDSVADGVSWFAIGDAAVTTDHQQVKYMRAPYGFR